MAANGPSPFFSRLIHRLYYQNSGLAHFFSHRIRPAGILLFVLVPISWILMPIYARGPVFQVRGMIMAVLVVSSLWILFRKAKVRIRRKLPRMATAGEPLHYRITISNEGKSKLSGANLLELAPDNRPDANLFSNSQEPGEEKRNLFDRVFCYYRWEWLQKNLSLFTSKPSDFLPPLEPGEQATLTLCLTPKKRGVVTLSDLRVCLPDPLGMFQRCRKTITNKDKLIVLPQRYQLPLLKLPGSARFQLGGEALSNSVGESGDYTSVRDYRPGDPLRHIHWKSWARTGKPIVKEYEDVFFPRYGLILDTFAPPEQADLFEQAVSVAASFAASIDTRETLLDLMFIHDKAHVFSSGRGEAQTERMLEVLAGVNCDPGADWEALQRLVLQYHDELTACICVFSGWCEQRRDTITRLQRSDMHLKILAVCHSFEEAEQMHSRHPSPVPVQWLRVDHMQEDLMLNIPIPTSP